MTILGDVRIECALCHRYMTECDAPDACRDTPPHKHFHCDVCSPPGWFACVLVATPEDTICVDRQ